MPRADGHLTNKEMNDVLQRLSGRKESWDSPAMQQEWLKKAADQEDFRRRYLSVEACEQLLRGKQIGKR